eukprot:CAMPEP_0118865040 /NCGR_PEP_ID=MMETSP1163-20130328/9433_1 /TAXON_ID=124430 /ORGANISM="Phaeomonas parva, Strain CCMP2877" /LENGTH=72 /DNA_ID=CAMNT_0006799231 /DNA_START=57 /DNA_END=271 /DNA_ORIENTATION=+
MAPARLGLGMLFAAATTTNLSATAMVMSTASGAGAPLLRGKSVGIIGGGVAGLSTALALEAKGVACTVYDTG